MHKRLLQLLRDNAQRASASAVKVEQSADGAVIYLYDVIDSYFGIGAETFNKALGELAGQPVQLRINSPGGDVFDGRAMATAIAQHGNVTAYIDGLAASAATYVALAAKSVEMADGSFFMIHNAWTFAYGNKADLTSTAALLDKIDQSIISDYAKTTGKPVDQITQWMDAETWFTAEEALDNGFITSVFDPKGGKNTENRAQNAWNLAAYSNAPKALTEASKPVEPDWQTQRAANVHRLRLLELG